MNHHVNSILHIGYLLLALGVVAGCSTVTLNVEGNRNAMHNQKTIALVETVISPPSMPTFPLIDAGIYKGNADDIAGEIMTAHQRSVGRFDQTLGGIIASNVKAKVVYGNELYGDAHFRNAVAGGVRTYPLNTDSEDFPKVAVPQGAPNFFDFSNVDVATEVFESPSAYQENMARLAQNMKVNAVVVAVVTVQTASVSAFGIVGTRYLRVSLYVFDAKGTIVLKGSSTTEGTEARAGDLADYQGQLALFNYEASRLIPALVAQYQQTQQ